MHWCSHTERCRADVLQKFKQWNAPQELIEQILIELENEQFIDENRYARAFVNDKFRFNKWGKTKIYHALKQKSIPDSYISEALQQIDEHEYKETAMQLMQHKNQQIDDEFHKRKQKLFRFMASRGFETGIIFELWDRMQV